MNKQKGFSIYLIIIMMGVLMAIVLGLSSMISGSIKVSAGLGDGTNAFYAADTGIEEALYRTRKLGLCTNFSGSLEDASYQVTITSPDGGDCLDGGTKIVSSGEYKGSKKNIEISY